MRGRACIVIPVQPFPDGKSRLAAMLEKSARAAMNRRFFQHVLSTALEAVGREQVIVISRAGEVRDLAARAGALPVLELQTGLNEALTQAASLFWARGADRVLALSTDLPELCKADLLAMLERGESADVVLAPDAGGTGTNAMLIGAAARRVAYRYGPQSFTAHTQACAALSLSSAIVRRPGLANDLDTPSDLERLSTPGRWGLLPPPPPLRDHRVCKAGQG